MMKLDNSLIDILCKNYGYIFKLAYKEGFDIEEFTEKMLNSDITKRKLELVYAPLAFSYPEEIFYGFLLPEIGREFKKEKRKLINEYTTYDYGFCLRNIQIRLNKSFSEFSEKLKYDEFVKDDLSLYANHSYDEICSFLVKKYKLI